MSIEERFAPLIARERAAMERGDTLDVVLARLQAENVRAIEAHLILRAIKRIAFGTAKTIVDDAWHGHCPKLDLDDLALLASVPHVCRSVWWLHYTIGHAIVGRQPVLRMVPGYPRHANEPGVIFHECGERFAEERDAMKRAIADEPAWARELEVLRDEPELFEVRFVRVR